MKEISTVHLLEMIADQNFSKNKEIEQKKRICAQLARGCSESDAVRHSHVTIGSRATGQIQTLYGQTLAPCTASAGMEN